MGGSVPMIAFLHTNAKLPWQQFRKGLVGQTPFKKCAMRQWAAILLVTAVVLSAPTSTLAQGPASVFSIAVLQTSSPLSQMQRQGVEAAVRALAPAGISLNFVDTNAKDVVNWLNDNRESYGLVLGPAEDWLLAQVMQENPDPGIPILSPLTIREFEIQPKGWFFRTNASSWARAAKLDSYIRLRRVAAVFEDSEMWRRTAAIFSSGERGESFPYKRIPLGSPVRPDNPGGSQQDGVVSIGGDLAAIASQLRDFRAEAVAIFADPAVFAPLRERLDATSVWGRTYSPLLLSIIDPRELAVVPDRLIFLSALPEPREFAGSLAQGQCRIQQPMTEAAALSYDAMALVIQVVQERKPTTGEQFRDYLAEMFTRGGSFRGPCTNMAFLGQGRSYVPLVGYEKMASSIRQTVPPLSLSGRLVLNVYGYGPALILVFFIGWSAAFANYEVNRFGIWDFPSPPSLAATVLVATSRLVTLLAICIPFIIYGTAWDSFPVAFGIALGFEVVYRVAVFETPKGLVIGPSGLTEMFLAQFARLVARWQYKDYTAAVNILALSNTQEALDQTVRAAISAIKDEHLRRRVEKKLGARLEEQDTVYAKRRVLADTLLQRLRWDQLIERGCVPSRYFNKDALEDPEPVVRLGADYFERHDLGVDDLDRLIRSRLGGRPTSFSVAYERGLLEGEAEARERQRLAERMRFIVHLFGPEYVKDHLDEMDKEICDLKRMSPAQVPRPTSAERVELPMLALLRLELENIRCFRRLSLDFSFDRGGRPWTMLLGDNGLGKTTILRAIAMALCDQPSAAAFMKSLTGELLRQETHAGSIRVELGLGDGSGPGVWSKTTLTRSHDGTVQLSQSRSSWFPRDRLFVCGYGAQRRAFGTGDYSSYAIEVAMRTLFFGDAQLQNPELVLRRMESAGQDMMLIRRRLESVLLLPEESAQISSTGIAIRGPWGQFVPAGAIGDGYLATLSWLSDLLGWAFFFRPGFLSSDISGIVLIDEIEKHLHPKWQREIVRQLTRQFPKVQFVATTHSPVCAGGLADLEREEHGMMYRFWNTASGAVEGESLLPFRGWTYDQIMTSKAFGLPVPRDVTTQEIVTKLRSAREAGEPEKVEEMRAALRSRSRQAAEDERAHEVREEIDRKLGEVREFIKKAES